MKRPLSRTRRRWRVALGFLLLPPLFWAAVLAIVPTDCARQRIAERLSAASGRTVTLGRLRVGVLGGVHLHDLRIGAPASGDDPWLKARDASINVSLFQLLFGHIDPTEIDVRGLDLRVLRRRDGSLELADLLQPTPDPQPAQESEASACEPTGLSVRLREATLRVVDEPTQTRLEFTRVEGRAAWKGRLASISELRGTVNGGPFQLTAQLDRSGDGPAFEGQVRVRDMALGEGMNALAYLVPVLAGAPARLDGRLALDLYARGRGDSRDALRRTLVGHGNVTLDPVQLDGSRFLAEFGRLVDLPAQGRVGAVRTDLTVKNGRIATENLTLDVAKTPVVLAGWTDFDGRLNYRLRTENLAERLPAKARDVLADLTIDLDALADVRVQGTVDALVVTLDGLPLNAPPRDPSRGGDDRQRLREIGRRLRDRIRR